MRTASNVLNTYARHDRAHCLMSGLFRLCPRRAREELHISAPFGNDVTLHAWGPSVLGAEELRVLQGLVSLAGRCAPGRYGRLLPPAPAFDGHAELRRGLYLEGDAQVQDILIADTSFCRLAKEIGFETGGGSTIQSIRKSIERLSRTTLVREGQGTPWSSQLLSFYEEETDDGSLHVAINPSITASIAGHSQFVHIDLVEVRALKTDAGRLLHQRLSALVDLGKVRSLKTPTLMRYLWPELDSAVLSRRELYKRRYRLRKALGEIGALSAWTLIEAEHNRLWKFLRKNTRNERFKESLAQSAAAAAA